MGPITYSLCHKPVIGSMMWILSLCVFPPPIPSTEIVLEEPGLALKTTFEAPVEKKYSLFLQFDFPTVQDALNDKIIGDGYNGLCEEEHKQTNIMEKNREYYGKEIPIKVVVRKPLDSTIVFEKTFQTFCKAGGSGNMKNRFVGYIPLNLGEHSIEVINISGQPELKGIKTKIYLRSGHGKEI